MRVLEPGETTTVGVLRALLFVLPCAALAVALPEVPHWAVVVTVVGSAAVWSRTPDHVVGALALVIVVAWWTTRGVVDWRLLVVGLLLLTAHVVAIVLSYGPPTLAVDPRLAGLWLRRGLLAVVPLVVTWLAIRGLEPGLAPPWAWALAAVLSIGLLAAAARLTQSTDDVA